MAKGHVGIARNAEDGGFVLYSNRWTISGDAEEYAALRAALLEGAQEIVAPDRGENPNAPMFRPANGGPLIVKTGGRYLLFLLEGESE